VGLYPLKELMAMSRLEPEKELMARSGSVQYELKELTARRGSLPVEGVDGEEWISQH
jgi:hypothetical protein